MNPQPITEKFIDECLRIQIKSKASPSSTNWFLLPNILFTKFSAKDFISILKDPVWIKATKSYWILWQIKTEQDIKKFSFEKKTSMATTLIDILFQSGHSYSDLVVRYADGILLRQALKVCEDFRLKRLVNRGLKSKDYRARKIAVKYCQTSKLHKMLQDSRKEVRMAAIERLGMHNIAHKVIDDPAIDIRLGAAVCLDDMDVIQEILELETQKVQDILNSNKKYKTISWLSKGRLIKIIAKLPKKQLLYNLDVKDAGGFVKNLVEAKLYETQE